MIQRCHNRNNDVFHLYGGRGISVCSRWRMDFTVFLADLPPRPSPKHSLDRVDNSLDYEPGNIQWATQTQQVRNSRRARLTLEAAEEARRLYASGGWTYVGLGAYFNVSKGTIGAVITNRTWKLNAAL